MTLKQKVNARSSAKVDYRSLALRYAKMIDLDNWIVGKTANVPIIFTDNISAKHLVANHVMYAHIKHTEIKFHFIRDLVVQEKNLMLDFFLRVNK